MSRLCCLAGAEEAELTPRERILAALQRRSPDRLPLMELSIDWKVARGLGFSGYFDLIEHLDLEAVSVNQVMYLLGLKPLLLKLKKSYTDAWGVRSRLTEELLPVAVGHPIRPEARLEDLRDFPVPDPRRDPVLKAVRHTVRRFKGRRAVMYVGRAVFSSSWHLCGMERLLESYLLDPEFVVALARLVAGYNQELHRLVIAEGADLIVLGDDYAHKSGPIMSPAHFRQFILPGLSEAVRNIQAAGARCIKHSDGNIWPLLEDIVGTGIDGLGPLEPAAGMDLREVKRRVGDRVCLVGNLDVDLLCRGTVEEVRQATRRLIEEVSPGGGHILSSGNSITSAVRPENFAAMVETARSSGRYPITAK